MFVPPSMPRIPALPVLLIGLLLTFQLVNSCEDASDADVSEQVGVYGFHSCADIGGGGLCTHPTYKSMAEKNCPVTCGACPPTTSPTTSPTDSPTKNPTASPTAPTASPTSSPTEPEDTLSPTALPTDVPTAVPTDVPTAVPTTVPHFVWVGTGHAHYTDSCAAPGGLFSGQRFFALT